MRILFIELISDEILEERQSSTDTVNSKNSADKHLVDPFLKIAMFIECCGNQVTYSHRFDFKNGSRPKFLVKIEVAK